MATANVPEVSAAEGVGAILEQLHAALLQVEADGDVEERDQMLKKLLGTLIQTASLLLETPVVGCENVSIF
jgi:hypothetical protein